MRSSFATQLKACGGGDLPIPTESRHKTQQAFLKALLAFPQNAKYRADPGLIHPGDVVRVK